MKTSGLLALSAVGIAMTHALALTLCDVRSNRKSTTASVSLKVRRTVPTVEQNSLAEGMNLALFSSLVSVVTANVLPRGERRKKEPK